MEIEPTVFFRGSIPNKKHHVKVLTIKRFSSEAEAVRLEVKI